MTREKRTAPVLGLLAVLVLVAVMVLGDSIRRSAAAPDSIYVPDDHGTIQGAVDAALAGDTIIVRDGTYTENVDVDKGVTIRSENGPGSTVVQAADPDDHVFCVNADNVEISGFTVQNATGSSRAGILLNGVEHCVITDNDVRSNTDGIVLTSSYANSLYNNHLDNEDEKARDDGDNTWNVEKSPGPNIVGGPYLGGNYWADCTGDDLDGDGLGDTPQDIASGWNVDELPLLEPRPDLMVIEKWEKWVGVGTYNVTYVVKNEGGAAAGNCTTGVYIDAGPWHLYDCPSLAAGDFDIRSVGPFALSGVGDSILVYADIHTGVDESNEENNFLRNEWGTLIQGVTAEVDCDVPVPEATVTLKKNGIEVDSTVSDGGGDYSLPVAETGDYDVIASKTGYKDQTESITVGQLGQEYELDFIGDSGLVPNAPDMSYVLKCVNRWLFPPDEECGLTMSTVLKAVNAWLFPT